MELEKKIPEKIELSVEFGMMLRDLNKMEERDKRECVEAIVRYYHRLIRESPRLTWVIK